MRVWGHGDLAAAAVLDVGCGTKLSKVLLDEQRPIGRYVGVDVDPVVIDFLAREVGDPRFSYHHLDVRNERYRPEAPPMAELQRYPVDDAAFDIVCAWSLLTHLYAEDIGHFFRLTRRAIAPSGYLLASVYLNQFSDTGWGALAYYQRLWEEERRPGALAMGRRLRHDEGEPPHPLADAAAGVEENLARSRDLIAYAARERPDELRDWLGERVSSAPDLVEAALGNIVNGDADRRDELLAALRSVLGDDPLLERAAARRFGPHPGAEPTPFPTGPPVADTVDPAPNQPGLMPVHTLALVERLAVAHGWSLEDVVEPTRSYQHVVVMRPA